MDSFHVAGDPPYRVGNTAGKGSPIIIGYKINEDTQQVRVIPESRL